jgi:hypothetical protein
MPRVRVSMALVKNCALSTPVTPLASRMARIALPPFDEVPRNSVFTMRSSTRI